MSEEKKKTNRKIHPSIDIIIATTMVLLFLERDPRRLIPPCSLRSGSSSTERTVATNRSAAESSIKAIPFILSFGKLGMLYLF